jgi:hypothetical protein
MKKVFVLTVIFLMSGLIYFVVRSSLLSKEYPKLLQSHELRDTIIDVIHDGRASARVTFSRNKKFTLPWAKIFYDASEINLPRKVRIGDIIIKDSYSDTIRLIQDNKEYVFVANSYLVEIGNEP